MTEQVRITITGYQTNEEGETDTNETSALARYFFRNGAHHIVYEDEESANSARYRLSHRTLEVVKNGDLTSKMIFEAGRTFTSSYRTPYGRMMLTFITQQYSFFEENGTLRVETSYRITNDRNDLISKNRLILVVDSLPDT